MSSPATRSSTQSKSKSPFIPGTPFLTESPAWVEGSPAYVDHAGRPYRGHSRQGARYSDELRSPIPPPPANLWQGSPGAINVDPGIPFLATAGPSDSGGSDRDSLQDEEPQSGRFVGGFVSGIKKVVRNSLKRTSRRIPSEFEQPPQQGMYAQPPLFRDSGYASSIPQAQAPGPAPVVIPPTGVLSPVADYPEASPTSSRRTRYSARPPSETLVGHQEQKYAPDEKFTLVEPVPIGGREPPEIVPPESILSPVSADPEYGSDYAQMNPPTPPPSDTSFNTYLSRLSKIVKDINNLPWVAKDRVTKDYYPEQSRRRDEPKRHPAILWRSEAYYQYNYEGGGYGDPASQPEMGMIANASDASGSAVHLITPRRRSRTTMDLDAEFDPTPRPTPLPARPIPPSAPASPSRLGQFSYQPVKPTPLPSDSVLFSSQFQPQQPQPNPPPPPSGGPAANWDQGLNQVNNPSIGTWQYPDDNTNYGVFATPKSATSRRSRRSSRSQNAAYASATAQPSPQPQAPSQSVNAQYQYPQVQPPRTPIVNHSYIVYPSSNPNSPSRSRAPEQWQLYPQERSGYVPYEFSENYYGSQYGPGVHAARPPVAPPPISGPSSTASLRQPP